MKGKIRGNISTILIIRVDRWQLYELKALWHFDPTFNSEARGLFRELMARINPDVINFLLLNHDQFIYIDQTSSKLRFRFYILFKVVTQHSPPFLFFCGGEGGGRDDWHLEYSWKGSMRGIQDTPNTAQWYDLNIHFFFNVLELLWYFNKSWWLWGANSTDCRKRWDVR